MINDHADAFMALLDADNAPPALVVYKGPAPKDAVPPYGVVYFDDTDPEDAESRSLVGKSDRFVQHATVQSVGGNENACLAVAARIRAGVLDVKPNVNGRNCFPIRRIDGQPPRPDQSTGTLVVTRVDVYRLESVPS